MIPNSAKFRSIVSARPQRSPAFHKTFFELSYSNLGGPTRLPHSLRSIRQPAPVQKLKAGAASPLAVLHARHLPMPSHHRAGEASCNCETAGGESCLRSVYSGRVVMEPSFPLLRSILPRIMTNRTSEIAARTHIRRSTGGRRRAPLAVGIGLGAVFGFGHAAFAADLPAKAPVPATSPAYDWTGWYIGAHAGVLRGSSNWTSTPLGPGGPSLDGAFDLPLNFDFMAGTGSYVLGLQGGYNYVLPSRVMLGIEGDVSFPNSDVVVPYSIKGSQTVASPAIGQVTYG